MIEITIDVTNATDEEKEGLEELYKKPLNEICRDITKGATLYYQDDNNKPLGSGLGLNKTIILFQSIDDLIKPVKHTITLGSGGKGKTVIDKVKKEIQSV